MASAAQAVNRPTASLTASMKRAKEARKVTRAVSVTEMKRRKKENLVHGRKSI
jgi:hypothetical protein